MDNREILHAVLAADKAARERLISAEKKQKILRTDAVSIRTAAEQAVLAGAEAEIETLRQQAAEASAAELAVLTQTRQQQLSELDKRFEEIKDSCAEQIFRATVGL